MELKALQQAIHDAAMAVRAGDLSQWDKLQELRKEHRKVCGIPEHAEVAEAPPMAEPKVEPTKKSSRKK